MNRPGRLVLIGHPVSHSLSPLMYNAALASAGIDLRYESIDVPPAELESILAQLVQERAAGNFTIPHKKPALRLMHECTPLAQEVGAVNTFWTDDNGQLAADNTDVAGFNAMVKELLGEVPEGARVAVVGAGGAASAVLTALETWTGATASVHARDLARAMAMRMRHSAVVRACSMRDPCLEEADIVVNATPIGMGTDEHPVELERLSPRAVVVDLVYAAGETSWVRAAREKGHVATDGLRMLLYQGAAAYELWFGAAPDTQGMWAALSEATGRS